jgi:hypothetical protein
MKNIKSEIIRRDSTQIFVTICAQYGRGGFYG